MVFLRAYQRVAYYITLLLFAAGGLELSVVSLIFGWLPSTERVERFFQRMIHWHFGFFHAWCDAFALVRVRYDGFERIPTGGVVLVVNHLSLIDITCLLARIPAAVCIFKPAIRRNPVLGAAARRAGYLGNDGGPDLVRTAADKIAAGNMLVIFPEGTRAPAAQRPLPFKAGFSLIARRAHAPIQLVRITTDSDLLTKDLAWWRLPKFPANVVVTVGPLLPVDCGGTATALAARVEAWFRQSPGDDTACASPPAAIP